MAKRCTPIAPTSPSLIIVIKKNDNEVYFSIVKGNEEGDEADLIVVGDKVDVIVVDPPAHNRRLTVRERSKYVKKYIKLYL